MPFVGQAEITIDAKQRLAIPAKFRQRLSEDELGGGLYCVPWPQGPTLRLYTAASFEQVVAELGTSLIQDSDDDELEAALFSAAELLDVDGNGRIRLPQMHLDLVEMPKDVMVIGAGNRLEIHDRARWQAAWKQQFQKLPALVAARKAKQQAAG